MQIIPVIDLKDGKAVAAHRGQRHRYLPQVSPLCKSGEPFGLLARLAAHYHTIYLADINALQGKPMQTDLLNRIRRRLPKHEFWLDAGNAADDVRGFRRVIGSESHPVGDRRTMLSLDYKNRRLLGEAPPPHRWPSRVLAINLGDVGGGGLDCAHLQALARAASNRSLMVGGGVSGLPHLRLLKRRGFPGALVASVLHSSALRPRLLAKTF